jgi:hypothetical protein
MTRLSLLLALLFALAVAALAAPAALGHHCQGGHAKYPSCNQPPPPPPPPDVDADDDGVVDTEDQCPTQPGPASNGGCPEPPPPPPDVDADDDGVVDTEDQCPNDPGPASNGGCPLPPPPPPPSGTGHAAAVVDLSWGISSADADRTYQELPLAGSKAIRVGVGWRSLETSPGVYSATKLALYDAIVQRARAASQRVLFNVVDTPGWANGGQGANVPPTDPNSIQPFLRFLANRYAPMGVEAFEIWNEQDTSRFWNLPDPARYAALLRASYTAIKSVQPNLKVVTGGTSGNDYSFWSRAYAAGIRGYFDAMGLHPYTGRTTPTYVYRDSSGRIAEWAFTGYREIRSLMLSHGDDKPIWFTEFGWSSATDGGWASVGLANQAQFLREAFQILRQDPYVELAFWYIFRDGNWSIDADFGLFYLNWTKKPIWDAYRAAAG